MTRYLLSNKRADKDPADGTLNDGSYQKVAGQRVWPSKQFHALINIGPIHGSCKARIDATRYQGRNYGVKHQVQCRR